MESTFLLRIACGHTARDTNYRQAAVTQATRDLQMHFELSVTMMFVPCRASLVWPELSGLESVQLQHRDVELAEASGKGETLGHHPVSHTGSCLHPGENQSHSTFWSDMIHTLSIVIRFISLVLYKPMLMIERLCNRK